MKGGVPAVRSEPQACLFQPRKDVLAEVLQVGQKVVKAKLHTVDPRRFQRGELLDDLIRRTHDLNVAAETQALLM